MCVSPLPVVEKLMLKSALHTVLHDTQCNKVSFSQHDSKFVFSFVAPQDQNATRQLSIVTPSKKYASGQLHEHVQFLGSSNISNELDLDDPDRHGQWRRRRRLDGALNRVPQDFYPQLWYLLSQVLYLHVHVVASYPGL